MKKTVFFRHKADKNNTLEKIDQVSSISGWNSGLQTLMSSDKIEIMDKTLIVKSEEPNHE